MGLKARPMEVKSPEARDRTSVADSVFVLLRNLIDYAGLFPPASLTMAAAVANYDQYLRSEFRWTLGRFIVPASRLGEFEQALAQRPSRSRVQIPWRLSVLIGTDISADLATLAEFRARAGGQSEPAAKVESVEAKATTPQEIERLHVVLPTELEAYFEIPLSENGMRDSLAVLASSGRRAKIRTGGETADKFPAAEAVLAFIKLCAAANVPFKATAGLHHPIRSVHRLTYQPDSPSGIMHGFLNVFLAAVFVRAGMATQLALELLREESAQAFHFDSEGITWRHHHIALDEIAAARQSFSISFGSCSFTEPIDDLRSLHLL